MTTYRTRVSAVLPILAVALLAACKTIPLPGAPDESLLIFLSDIDGSIWKDGVTHVAGGTLTVLHVPTRKVYTVPLGGGSGYGLAALPPGEYIVTGLQANLQRDEGNGRTGSWTNTHSLYATFFVAPNTVEVCSRTVKVGLTYQGYNVYTYTSSSTDYAARKLAIRAELEKNRRWAAWEDSQIVNFGE
jgi:hypothetical protein